MSQRNLAVRLLITAKDQASGVLTGLKNHAGKIAGAIAGYFTVGLFRSAVQEAEQLDVQMRKLEAVIEATGGAAGLSAQEIDQLARKLDEATTGSAAGFRDAAIQLATFKSVGKDAFETTLMLAQDLADAGFGSVTSNAVQLGKALEDPVKGLSALTRSGVTFTEQQQEVIKSLVETGRQAEAQAIILEAVQGQVGGVASAMGGGLTGAIDLVNKRFTDLKEQLGTAVLPVLEDLYNRLAEVFARLRDSGQIEELGKKLASALKAVSNALVSVIEFTARWAKELTALAIAIAAVKLAAMVSTLASVTKGMWAAATATKAMTVATTGLAVAGNASGLSALVGVFAKLKTLVMVGGPIGAGIAVLTLGVKKLADAWHEANMASERAIRTIQERSLDASERALKYVEYLGVQAKSEEELLQMHKQGYESYKERLEGAIKYHTALVEQAEAEAELGREQQEQMAFAKERLAELQAAHEELHRVLGDGSKLRESEFDRETGMHREQQQQLAALAEAYEVLGITSSESLQEAALQADAAYQAIKNSAVASTDDAAKAFMIYAERAITANGGIISSSLEVEASQYGIQLEVTETGRVISRELGSAQDDVDELADAFKRMGIKSKDDLKTIAGEAKSAYDLIKKSGQASATQLQKAFETYAKAAIEANDGVVDSALEAEAKYHDLQLEVDETGKVIVKSMSEASKATDTVAESAGNAAEELKKMASEAEKASEKMNKQDKDDKKDAETSNKRKFRSLGQIGSTQKLELLKQGQVEAAKIFEEMALTFGQTVQGKALRPEWMKQQLDDLKSAALKQVQRQQAEQSRSEQRSGAEKPKPKSFDLLPSSAVERVVRVEFYAPGQSSASGSFEGNEAEKLLRQLESVARISR